MQKVHFIWRYLKYRGQISILMALIFPVLFVFFAMTINIGLLVHDKINLQNSVDLAVYYGATKQAEILNAIAHINYQLRQNWKLLAFRLRGFGDLWSGKKDSLEGHPWKIDSQDWDERYWKGNNNKGQPLPATVCTQAGKNWSTIHFGGPIPTSRRSDICKNSYEVTPAIPIVEAVQGGLVYNLSIELEDATRRARGLQVDRCENHGPSNWLTAALWVFAYRYNLIIRKMAIGQLAKLLQEGKDLSGKKIEDGVKKTFENNLTRSNRDAFRGGVVLDYYNSMDGPTQDDWLVERPLFPTIYYTDSQFPDPNRGGCGYTIKGLDVPPHHITDNLIYTDMEDIIKNVLKPMLSEPQDPKNKTRIGGMDISRASIVSYEKNPWYMVYSGLSVELQSGNEIFSPFSGSPPTLKAKAFAKPFGGRIGPWMFPTWEAGEPVSRYNDNAAIDQTLQPIIVMDSGESKNSMTNDVDPFAVPNYSRYPGDTLGLASQKALGVYRPLVDIDTAQGAGLSYNYFFEGVNKLGKLVDPDYPYDPLAWPWEDPPNPDTEAPKPRIFEILAVAPDLFDITYYSIDPQFHKNHRKSIEMNPDIKHVKRAIDLGDRPGNNNYEGFNVFDQWAWMHNPSHDDLERLPPWHTAIGSYGEWFVKEWQHLLTGWVPKSNLDSAFGKCEPKGDLIKKLKKQQQDGKASIPGSCGIGGRMGYSVKLVSERYLKRTDLKLGGDGTAGGEIANGPP